MERLIQYGVRMKKDRRHTDFWKEQHQSVAKVPFVWFMDGERLRRSYKILSDRANESFGNENYYSPIGPALMLAGYALENIFKGILVKNDCEGAFDAKGKFKHKSHDLLVLAQNANILLSDEEKELLEILTHSTVSSGRYPIPLYYDEMLPRVFNDGSIALIDVKRYCNITMRYKVCDQVDTFFEKLAGHYDLPTESSPTESD